MKHSTGSLAALIGVVLIGMTGFGVFLPVFPFLSLELGASPTATTIAMGAYSLGQLVSSPYWGRLSDRVGRKPVLIAGLVGSVVSYLWIARAGSVEELGAARLFGGLMAGNIGAAFASAADLANDKTRARNMGLLGAGVGFGFIAGPALGGLLIGDAPSRADFAIVCMASAALAGAAALAAALLFRETHHARADRSALAQPLVRWRLLRSRPALARLAAAMLLVVAAQAMMETTFALWADVRLRWGPREVAWTLAGLGAASVVLQGGGAGRAARVLGERVTLMIGLGLFAAGLAGLGVATTLPTLIAALTIFVIGLSLATPALNALIAASAGDDERGAVMGMSQSASALGRVIGPLLAGPLFEFVGPAAPFTIGALVVFGALFAALRD
jgi:MFS transporter, DHA1 family, tetracycline resistance protein